MKVLEFIYQDSVIHFAMNPGEKNVMVNATEMARAFGKRVDVFLKTKHSKDFVEVLKSELKKDSKLPPNGGRSEGSISNLNLPPNGGNSAPITEDRIIKGRNGVNTYFHRALALKFAAWLDPEFEYWVYTKIEDLVFGNYKRHWEAHALEEKAKEEMTRIKPLLLANPTAELVQEYFQAESSVKEAKRIKRKAIQNQLNLFNQSDDK